MDSSGHPAESDGNPHPRVIEFLGVFIAVLTLTLPLYTISLYSPPDSSPASQVEPQLLLGQREVLTGPSP